LGFLAEAFVGRLAAESAARAVVVVVVLPLLQTVGEKVHVVDDLAFEEPESRPIRPAKRQFVGQSVGSVWPEDH
jgi:hypothetical protein